MMSERRWTAWKRCMRISRGEYLCVWIVIWTRIAWCVPARASKIRSWGHAKELRSMRHTARLHVRLVRASVVHVRAHKQIHMHAPPISVSFGCRIEWSFSATIERLPSWGEFSSPGSCCCCAGMKWVAFARNAINFIFWPKWILQSKLQNIHFGIESPWWRRYHHHLRPRRRRRMSSLHSVCTNPKHCLFKRIEDLPGRRMSANGFEYSVRFDWQQTAKNENLII